MSDYKPNAGDRVRVVLEGEVQAAGVTFVIGSGLNDCNTNIIRPFAEHVVSVERLPDPEPDFQQPEQAS